MDCDPLKYSIVILDWKKKKLLALNFWNKSYHRPLSDLTLSIPSLYDWQLIRKLNWNAVMIVYCAQNYVSQ